MFGPFFKLWKKKKKRSLRRILPEEIWIDASISYSIYTLCTCGNNSK